jgi:hypothetical protein
MTEQTRAAGPAQSEDAWDRLAALAFGVGGSTGGCSEQAHAYDCTCGLPAALLEESDPEHDQYPDYTDTEMEIAD